MNLQGIVILLLVLVVLPKLSDFVKGNLEKRMNLNDFTM